jgi:hypothetical protein
MWSLCGAGGDDALAITQALLACGLEGSQAPTPAQGDDKGKDSGVRWSRAEGADWGDGPGKSQCLVLRMTGEVTCVTWHAKGDYLATLVPTAGGKGVMIHQVRWHMSNHLLLHPSIGTGVDGGGSGVSLCSPLWLSLGRFPRARARLPSGRLPARFVVP